MLCILFEVHVHVYMYSTLYMYTCTCISIIDMYYTLYIAHALTLAGLGEFRIRDLNDEINKLLREKRHWEERILELGGPDHNVS